MSGIFSFLVKVLLVFGLSGQVYGNSESKETNMVFKRKAIGNSEFAFFRATNHLFYRFWHQKKRGFSGAVGWIQGDAHIQNLGFFDDGQRILFDWNDFDEVAEAALEIDLIRFASSLYVMASESACRPSTREIQDLAQLFFQTYAQSTFTSVYTPETIPKALREIDDLPSSLDHKKLLKKWTDKEGDQRKFDFSSSRLSKLSEAEFQLLQKTWAGYAGKDSILDAARRLEAGLGSLGMQRFYILVDQKDREDCILDLKEQGMPAFLKESPHKSTALKAVDPALRVKTATQILLPFSLPDLGHLTMNQKSYLVRRISPAKKNFEPADFTEFEQLQALVEVAANLLSRSHSRGSQSFESFRIFMTDRDNQKKLHSEALQFAKQNRQDFERFLDGWEF